MKIKKSFLSVLLVAAFAMPALAFTPTLDEGTSNTKALKEIKSLVQNINFDYEKLDQKTVKVHFMVNTSNELVVLRTNSKDIDRVIKYALNYKELKNRDLQYNKVYILPISFQSTTAG